MRIGIDATWLKPQKSGGVEVFLENILHGILKLADLHSFFDDTRVSFVLCNTNANDVAHHLLWQNTKEYSVLLENNLHFVFFPVYEMPIYRNSKIKCVTVIHDLQALHFPEYFKLHEKMWFHLAWPLVVKNSNRVVGISAFPEKDIQSHYKNKGNIVSILNPVVMNLDEDLDFQPLAKKYGIEKNKYFYTVCSMHKHKNLNTLVNVIEKIIKEDIDLPKKLVISGVSGPNKASFQERLKQRKLEDYVMLTEFVTDEVRNCLIKNSNCFLFPSVFEGFGMPPVEAMELGAKVIATNMTSIPEVTKGKCPLVNNPFDVNEWIQNIQLIQNKVAEVIHFKEYESDHVARKYLDLFYEVAKEG